MSTTIYSNKMKAITRNRYGGPEVLEIREIDKPKPSAKELLVRVHATTVNRTDCGILTGKPWLIRAFVGLLRPRDKVPGSDFAGVVEGIGDELGPNWENLWLALYTPLLGGKRVVFPTPSHCKRSMQSMLEKGTFQPVIDRHFPMDRVAEAYAYVCAGQKTGNVILDIE